MRAVLIGVVAFATTHGLESPRGQYEALIKEYDAASKAAPRGPQPKEFAPRFFALAEAHPDDPAALDSLVWVASECVFGPEAERALGMIARDHGRSERLKDFCGECSRYGEPFPAYEAMLRAILKDSPHRDVRGAATLALADHLKTSKERTESNLITIALHTGHTLSKSTLKNLQAMKERGIDKVGAESESLFQTVIDRYPDLRIESNSPQNAAELAKGELAVLRNFAIGRRAPEIVGKDIHGKPMRLSDYRGKVVVLDFGSHRSCGVCRQYSPDLRSLVESHKEKPFALLGISVDDDINDLKALAEKGENTWPIWWDGVNLEGPIASQWVISSMPTFFVLDPNGVIRNKGWIQPYEIEATVDMLLKEMGGTGHSKSE
jgi:peroxiredoxin